MAESGPCWLVSFVGLWPWEWSPIHGWSSCWICSSRCRSGTSTSVHILGHCLFGEFRKSSGRTYMLLGSMLPMFVVAVAVLMASSGQRKYLQENHARPFPTVSFEDAKFAQAP